MGVSSTYISSANMSIFVVSVLKGGGGGRDVGDLMMHGGLGARGTSCISLIRLTRGCQSVNIGNTILNRWPVRQKYSGSDNERGIHSIVFSSKGDMHHLNTKLKRRSVTAVQ